MKCHIITCDKEATEKVGFFEYCKVHAEAMKEVLQAPKVDELTKVIVVIRS